MFAQGVPMISGGDEISRTQSGNNNGYCQDNELSWHHWDLGERERAFFEFASRVSLFRRQHPNFRRRSYYEAHREDGVHGENLQWYRADGNRMEEGDWATGWIRILGMFLHGDAKEMRNAEGQQVEDWDFLLILNAHHEPGRFRVPHELPKGSWRVMFDTARPQLEPGREKLGPKRHLQLEARSFVLLGHER
jgi:isoamylase